MAVWLKQIGLWTLLFIVFCTIINHYSFMVWNVNDFFRILPGYDHSITCNKWSMSRWYFGACSLALSDGPLFFKQKNDSFIEWEPAESSHFITADSLSLLHDKAAASPCQLGARYHWPLCSFTSFTEAACQTPAQRISSVLQVSGRQNGNSEQREKCI